ncbi:MAG: chloride channel protein [Anaerolineae bacterium]|nr:chloride channel protein [Anaerolineae bacterium]
MKKLLLTLCLMVTAVVSGVFVAGVTAYFLKFLYRSIEFLWHDLPALVSPTGEIPYFTLFLGIIGGILVGLCHKYLGDHPKLLQDSIASFQKTNRFDYTHIWQGALTAGTSLLFGASLGPEAALLDLAGGLSTWSGDQMRKIGVPAGVVAADEPWPRAWKWALFLVALVSGMATFKVVAGDLFSGGLLETAVYQFHYLDLLWAVPVGIAGAVGGVFFNKLQAILPPLLQGLKGRPVLRSLSGGMMLGVLASIFPLILFSGQHELQPLHDSSASVVFWFVLLTGIAKFFVTSFLLTTGWKGGQFLPIMLGGAALGLAISMLIPGVSPIVAVIGGMAGSTVAVIRQPLAVVILLLLFFPLKLVGVMMVAALVGLLIARPFALPPGQIVFGRAKQSAASASTD